jgi:DNA repair exonuclease SbcCD ATPase subunit
MKSFAWLLMIIFLIPISAHAAVYEWKDDKGVVNFTDNPDKIPVKYMKRVKKRPSIDVDTTESTPSAVQDVQRKTSAAPESAAKEKELLYGGHNEEWWRSAFAKIREELKTIQDKLPEEKQDLEAARRKMAIYQYPKYRQAYYDLKSEIEKDEARIEELNKQLESLDNDASRAAVPLDWRK